VGSIERIEQYDCIASLTFPTIIYPIATNVADACPSVLLYERSMI